MSNFEIERNAFADNEKGKSEFEGAKGLLKVGAKVFENGAEREITEPTQIDVIAVDYDSVQIRFPNHATWVAGWVKKEELRDNFEREEK